MTQHVDRRCFLNVSLFGGAGFVAAALQQPVQGEEGTAMQSDRAPTAHSQAGNLLVGAAAVDITPDKPAPLCGQMYLRLSTKVESPITAQAVALETHSHGKTVDQAVFVSCDLVGLGERIMEDVRKRVKERLADLDVMKIVISVVHTHSAPHMDKGGYEIPKDNVEQPEEYRKFLVGRVAEVVVKAWESRKPGFVGWGLGHAVVAQNRRAVYADGHAQMYGQTNRPDFRRLEGFEDHAVEVLCFWDEKEKLVATAVNVPCPAQEVEDNYAISADYWHEVRKLLRAKHGDKLIVLGWIGAAGDQSPHLMFRKDAEERMRKLRGLTRLQEIARRIDAGWEDAYAGACKDKRPEVALIHKVETIELPKRHITKKEYAEAKKKLAMLTENPDSAAAIESERAGTRARLENKTESTKQLISWYRESIARYEQQKAGRVESCPMELHVVRLGDVAIASNPFELFTEYGVQMKARSPAIQTFVIQLAGGGAYLPSELAIQGGGYGATPESNYVGPEGGQVLVDETVAQIDSMWPKDQKSNRKPEPQ